MTCKNPPSTWSVLDWASALTLLLAGVGGLLVGFSWLLTADAGPSAADSVFREPLGESRFASLVESGHWIGDQTAPAVLLVYNDYRCGYSAELHRTLGILRERYPQHLAIVYKHFVNTSAPQGRAYRVPEGVECAAEQGRFESYHNAVFNNPRVLKYFDGPERIARAAGMLDTGEFDSCVRSRRHAARIREQHEEAAALGVSATPTLFLNGLRIVGAVPLTQLDSMIVREFPRRIAAPE